MSKNARNKSFINKIILTGGAVMAALFLFFDLTGMDAEPGVTSGMWDNGTLPAKTDAIIGAFQDSEKNLFLVWKNKDTSSIAYNYYDGTSWSAQSDVHSLPPTNPDMPSTPPAPTPIQAGYGISAISLFTHPTHLPIACIFFKAPGSSLKGSDPIERTCGFLEYENGSTPKLNWQPEMQFTQAGDAINMPSFVNSSTAPWDFYFIRSKNSSNYSSTLEGRVCNTSIGYQGAIIFQCYAYITPSNFYAKVPNLVRVTDENNAAKMFLFYGYGKRDEYTDQDNLIYYYDNPGDNPHEPDLDNKEVGPIMNAANETLATLEPMAVREFTGANSEPAVYLAYKEINSDSIGFSKVATPDLMGETRGLNQWKHCQLKDGDHFMTPSVLAPTLVEYDNKLYIYFSNSDLDGQIAYQRIDNINVDDDPRCQSSGVPSSLVK